MTTPNSLEVNFEVMHDGLIGHATELPDPIRSIDFSLPDVSELRRNLETAAAFAFNDPLFLTESLSMLGSREVEERDVIACQTVDFADAASCASEVARNMTDKRERELRSRGVNDLEWLNSWRYDQYKADLPETIRESTRIALMNTLISPIVSKAEDAYGTFELSGNEHFFALSGALTTTAVTASSAVEAGTGTGLLLGFISFATLETGLVMFKLRRAQNAINRLVGAMHADPNMIRLSHDSVIDVKRTPTPRNPFA